MPHAGDSVLRHICEFNEPARDALASAKMENSWLAAGPIRPGIRVSPFDRVFRLGNAAGEAHPAIAEGISMALQSAQMLTRMLVARQEDVFSLAGQDDAAKSWASLWRQAFAFRIRASAIIARLSMSPRATALLPVITRFPRTLSFGAHLAGKARSVV